ncbi:ORC2-domain-containing protein [Anaeromyces robustus]|uniref:Origin recognition complex subunit 2 n=1 Tax=Anaeromyces robustus TaxID=1754192 RepID=A0A1Y1XJ40_9FUNG|nr:ORC2-domain-containing protein [Anaeromyces robustus]|eukprot:ORX85777.1 ORC2-domain-containing protein [Anaeromyces robustus]
MSKKLLPILYQSDSEIPLHFVTTYKKNNTISSSTLAAAKRTFHLDTLAQHSKKKKKILSGFTVEKENIDINNNYSDPDFIPTKSNDDNKENDYFTGKNLYGFEKKNKSGLSIYNNKRNEEDSDIEEEEEEEEDDDDDDEDEDNDNTRVINEEEVNYRAYSYQDNNYISDEEEEEGEQTKINGLQRIEDEIENAGYEQYFQNLHNKKNITSNNTLSKLPILDHKEYLELLKKTPKKHTTEIKKLVSFHENDFQQWYFELVMGFNLAFYGFGSKINLLTKFAKEMLNDSPVFVINGFSPAVSVKSVLNGISEQILKYSGVLGSVQEQISRIEDYFTNEKRKIKKLFLLIHNIDGINFRNDKSQTTLSLIAAIPNIHVIASVDHINASFLWDNIKVYRYNFIWHDITTFESYTIETSFENSFMLQKNQLDARGVMHVLSCLTSNGRKIFRVLAEHQIIAEAEDMDRNEGISGGDKDSLLSTTTTNNNNNNNNNNTSHSSYESLGLSHSAYYNLCLEKFLVSNETTFRTQLTEFKDHKIIYRKVTANSDVYYIPLSATTLSEILENIE